MKGFRLAARTTEQHAIFRNPLTNEEIIWFFFNLIISFFPSKILFKHYFCSTFKCLKGMNKIIKEKRKYKICCIQKLTSANWIEYTQKVYFDIKINISFIYSLKITNKYRLLTNR